MRMIGLTCNPFIDADPGIFITVHEFHYRESQTEAGPVRRLYGLRNLNGAVNGPEKDRSHSTGLEAEESERLRTVRTAYGLGRI